MAGLNKVMAIGRMGADPEIKTLNSGSKIANLRIAVSERWRDKQSGDMKEKTEWISVVVFNENLVKVVENYTRKGSQIYIEGKLRTRKWQDQQGNDRYSTEVVLENFNGTIVLLDSKKDGDQGGGGGGGDYSSQSGGGYGGANATGRSGPREDFSHEDPDDSIPF